MKRIVSTIMGLLSITSFLLISVSYHSKIEDNFINAYYHIFSDLTPSDYLNIFSGNYKENFTLPYFENLLALLFLILSVVINKKYLIMMFSFILVTLWIKNYIYFGGIMDSSLYFKTSIPFFIIILNIFNFTYKQKSVSNS